MSPLTTHVLDTSTGLPAANVSVELAKRSQEGVWQIIANARTNADGRIAAWPALDDTTLTLECASYRLSFNVAQYFQSRGQSSFFPEVQVVFEVTDLTRHTHVPLLLSPYGYSTYRGS